MKNIFARLLVVALLSPFAAMADVKSDMENSANSLVNVMNMAMADGMTVAEAVSAMIEADRSQGNAIVATGMVVAPGEFAAIIAAAIDAGLSADSVVAAALIASDGENADQIIAAAISAAPGQKDAIAAASVRALPETSQGIQAIAASPMTATTAKGTGGGASATAADVQLIQGTLNQIEADLVAAGFTGVEAANAVGQLTASLESSQQTVAQATAALNQVQLDLATARAAQEALIAAAVEQSALQAQVEAQEAQINASLAEAAAARAAAEKATADLAAAQESAAQAAVRQAEQEALKAEVDLLAATDEAAAKAKLQEAADEKQAAAEATGFASAEAASAEATQKKIERDSAADEKATVELELAAVNDAIAKAEAAAVSAEALTALQLTTASRQDLLNLRAELEGRLSVAVQVFNAAAVDFVNATIAADRWTEAGRLAIAADQAAIDLNAALSQIDDLIAKSEADTIVSQEEADQLANTINTLTAEAEQSLADLDAELDTYTDAVSDAADSNSKVADLEEAADLDKIADGIDDVVASVSTTG